MLQEKPTDQRQLQRLAVVNVLIGLYADDEQAIPCLMEGSAVLGQLVETQAGALECRAWLVTAHKALARRHANKNDAIESNKHTTETHSHWGKLVKEQFANRANWPPFATAQRDIFSSTLDGVGKSWPVRDGMGLKPSAIRTIPGHNAMGALTGYRLLYGIHHDKKQTDMALQCLREAAEFYKSWIVQPFDEEDRVQVAHEGHGISAPLRHAGRSDEALVLCDITLPVLETLARQFPERAGFLLERGFWWTQKGNSLWKLDRHEEALAAFRKSVQDIRGALAKTAVNEPANISRFSMELDRCLKRLSHWTKLSGHYEESASCVLERERLYPFDANRLMDFADEFHGLAELVEAAKAEVPSAKREQEQRYREARDRLTTRAIAVMLRDLIKIW